MVPAISGPSCLHTGVSLGIQPHLLHELRQEWAGLLLEAPFPLYDPLLSVVPWPGRSASPFLFLVVFRAQHSRHFQHKCQEECHYLVLALFTTGYAILWHRCLLTHSWRFWFLNLQVPLSSSAAITLRTSDSSCTLLKSVVRIFDF